MISKVHCLNKMRQYRVMFSISAIGLQISAEIYDEQRRK